MDRRRLAEISRYAGDEKLKSSGLSVMKVGSILFIIFGAFFEIVFSNFNVAIFPLLLIAVGGYWVVYRSGILPGKGMM